MKSPTFLYYLSQKSFLTKIGFLAKFLFFMIFSMIALFSKNYNLNFMLAFVLLSLILLTRFPKHNKKIFIAIIWVSTIICLFWLLLSRVEDSFHYVNFWWGTYITENTLQYMMLALSRWLLVAFAGILFMIITSESDLIKFLLRLNLPKEIVLSFTIAFNTVDSTLREIPKIDYALKTRGFNSAGLYKKIKRIYHIGTTSFLSSIKKIDTLNQSYSLRSENDNSKFKSLEVNIDKLELDKIRLFTKIKVKVEKGKPLLVFGGTGSGKTIFLKFVAGLIPDLQKADFVGKLKLDKKYVQFEDYRKNVALCFQEAEEQFMLDSVGRELFFDLQDNKKKIAYEMLKYFNIKNLKGKSLKDLSTGQRKLISIISSLSQDKPIVLLDEPTANLDRKNAKKLINLLATYSKNKILIISSHDSIFQQLCSRFLVKKEESWHILNNCHAFRQMIARNNFFPIKKNKVSGEILLEVNNFSFAYPDGTKAIKSLSLKINKGAIIGLIGENGSGKTTLVKQIADGRLKPKNLKVALVMQEPEKQIFTENVEKELTFGVHPEFHSLDVLKEIGLYHIRDKHPYFISRGQKQILLIATIILQKPGLLIIDEPFTGLDYNSVDKIKKMIIRFNRNNNQTVIITDQDGSRLKDIADQIIYLKEVKV